jgi:hypothetical protein
MTRFAYVTATRLHRRACEMHGNRPYYEYTDLEARLSDLQARIILARHRKHAAKN